MTRHAQNDIALITQMRAGTHYMCAAMRTSLEATLYRPDRERQFVVMEDSYIRKGLHGSSDEAFALPAAAGRRSVHFCHYYHPQRQLLTGMPKIYLVGFPPDSFYSDGVVASQATNDPAPSGPRAASYVMRFESPEWRGLQDRMKANSDWLMEINENDDALILRYEDLFLDFDASARRLEGFVGEFVNPLPKPTKNERRTYWTEKYLAAFDHDALAALWRYFAPSLERFYPERLESLRAAL
jgi:hypothetical protein